MYDVHEHVQNDIMSKRHLPRPLRRVVALASLVAEKLGGLWFDAIVTVSPEMAVRFPNRKTYLVRNFPILDSFQSTMADKPLRERLCRIGYIGTIARDREAIDLAKAVRTVANKHRVKLVLVGRFSPPELEAEIRQIVPEDSLEIVGWLDQPAIPNFMANLGIGVHCISNKHPNAEFAHATKVFEYMATGLPQIVSDQKINRDVVDSARCGLSVPADDAKALADAILYLMEHADEAEAMGVHGRRASAQYSWATEEAELLRCYDDILRR